MMVSMERCSMATGSKVYGTYKLILDLSVLFLKLGSSLLECRLVRLLRPGRGSSSSSVVGHSGRTGQSTSRKNQKKKMKQPGPVSEATQGRL